MLNSTHIQRKIENSPNLQALFQSAASRTPGKPNRPGKGPKAGGAGDGKQPREVIDILYLTVLSRFPTADELKTVAAYVQSGSVKREAVVDMNASFKH